MGVVHQSMRAPSPKLSPASPKNSSSPRHITSMKSTRSRKKISYISRESLIGIALSAVLSCIFALTLVLIIRYGGPIAIDWFKASFFPDENTYVRKGKVQYVPIEGDGNIVNKRPPLTTLNVAAPSGTIELKSITKVEDLTCAKFIENNYKPLLFSLGHREKTQYVASILEQLVTTYAEHPVQQSTLGALHLLPTPSSSSSSSSSAASAEESQESVSTFGIGLYRTGDKKTLSPRTTSYHHFVSDTEALLNMPRLREILEAPVLVDDSFSKEIDGKLCSFSTYVKFTLEIGRNVSSLSGTPFCSQSSSLHELLVGKRRWVLYAPDRLPSLGFNPLENLDKWLSSVYEKLDRDEMPVEIVQEAGQFVYVPEGWYFASTTLSDESISVKYSQSVLARTSFLYYAEQGDDRMTKSDYSAAIKMYKLGLAISRDYYLLQRLAVAFEKKGWLEDAVVLYQEAVGINPRDPTNYAKMIDILVSFSNRDESTGVSELLQQAASAGIKEEVLNLVASGF